MNKLCVMLIILASVNANANTTIRTLLCDDALKPSEKIVRELSIAWDSAADQMHGAKAHLRLTIEKGLRYITIHDEAGTQIFDSSAYREGAIYTTPEVPARGFDAGDGFRLTAFSSDHDPREANTSTVIEKKYTTPDGAKIRLGYLIDIDSRGHIDLLNMNYEYEKNHYFVVVHMNLYKGRFRGSSILLFYDFNQASQAQQEDLTIVTKEPEGDEIVFYFDSGGSLVEIKTLGEISKPNPLWTDREFMQAIRKVRAIGKGQVPMIQYLPSTPEAKILFKVIFGHEISEFDGLSFSSFYTMLKAATDEKELDLSSILNFKTPSP